MVFTANNVAIKSTPRFQLTLQDGEHVFYPEVVLYRVQAQKEQTLEWVDVGEVQRTQSTSNVIDIYLTPELTDLVEGCTLLRRLVVQVAYTDAGQTLNSTQSIEFTLQDLPVLSDSYEEGQTPSDPDPLVVSGSSRGKLTAYWFTFGLNTPVHKVVSAECGVFDPVAQEVAYEDAEALLLAGNTSGVVHYEPEDDIPAGTEVYIRLVVETLVKHAPYTLTYTVVLS